MIPTIQINVYDVRNTLLATETYPAYQPGKRLSVWAAGAQRKLDAMLAEYDTASWATIGRERFLVRKGVSLFTHF